MPLAPAALMDALLAFRARYPTFDSAPDAQVEAWLSEGYDETLSWAEGDRQRGMMLYAAHRLASNTPSDMPAGVTSFKSGTFNASFSEAAANRTGFDATPYGREYLALMRRNFAGPMLAWPVTHV